jgi:hypothetical protein
MARHGECFIAHAGHVEAKTISRKHEGTTGIERDTYRVK